MDSVELGWSKGMTSGKTGLGGGGLLPVNFLRICHRDGIGRELRLHLRRPGESITSDFFTMLIGNVRL